MYFEGELTRGRGGGGGEIMKLIPQFKKEKMPFTSPNRKVAFGERS